jgi:predicted ribosome quality control (RQC) complex YloA/Tae2 family protein
MNIDFFTTAALADEFRLSLMGGRVQKVVQVTSLSFGLEIYAQRERRYLYLSAHPQASRAHLQDHKPRRGVGNETPLLQLFRKYLQGSALMIIEHPPYERVLLFHFSGKNGQSTVVLELLGSRSNLICLDAAKRIMGLARPMAPQDGGQRTLLPNHQYVLPPPQNKLTVKALRMETLRGLIGAAPPNARLSKVLVNRLAGLSPLVAREIVYRAYQDINITADQAVEVEPLLETIRLVYAHVSDHSWSPHVSFTKNQEVEYFSPIALTHLESEQLDSISEAVEAHFSRLESGPVDDYFAARLPVRKQIEQAEARLARRLKKLDQDAAALKAPENYRQKGEAILTYSFQIQPRQAELEVLWTDEEPLVIALDPNLSPSENAQKYFARYHKAKRAADIIPQQRQTVALQLEYLEQLALDLELAESRPEIDAVAGALREAGFGKKRAKKRTIQRTPPPSQFRQFHSPDGFVVWVGKNARQNHQLTFGKANPDDVWLHARGVPGSHVIISTVRGRPPRSTILWAAGLAAYYSKARGEKRVDVSYTLKKHVRPIKGAPPGLVTIRQEKTARVAPLAP